MKLIIASDIHGSEYYCEKLLNCYRAEKGDRLLLLGDLLYHGPRNDLPDGHRPKGVIELLNDMRDELFCVRGNCDCEVDQAVLSFPMLAEYALIDLKDRMMFATHGHIFNKNNMPALKSGDILIHGHTHIPACENINGIFYINPGSVSIPRDGSHHGYIALENNTFSFKDLSGNLLREFTL